MSYKEGTKVVLNISYKGQNHGKDVILDEEMSDAQLDNLAKGFFYETFGEVDLPKETKMVIPPGVKNAKYPDPMPEWFTVNGTTIKKPVAPWRWDIP